MEWVKCSGFLNVTKCFQKSSCGNSLVVQWLGVCSFTSEGLVQSLVRGTKIPQAKWLHQKNKKKREREKEAVVQGESYNQMSHSIKDKVLKFFTFAHKPCAI